MIDPLKIFGPSKKKSKNLFSLFPKGRMKPIVSIPPGFCMFPKMSGVMPKKRMPQKRYLKQTRGVNTSRFGDFDKDMVINGLDCFPFNRKKHTTPIKESKYITMYHGTQKKYLPKIKKEGLRGYQSITPSKSAAIMHAERGPERWKLGGFRNVHAREEKDYKDKTDPVVLRVTIPNPSHHDSTRPSQQMAIDPYTYHERYARHSDIDFEDVYEYKTQHTIPPKQIHVEKFDSFKRKAFRTSRMPEHVGKIYNPLPRKFKESVDNVNLQVEGYPGEKSFKQLQDSDNDNIVDAAESEADIE